MTLNHQQIAFVSSHLDRSSELRKDSAKITTLKASASTRWVHVKGDGVRMDGQALLTSPPQDWRKAEAVFLGVEASGEAWFAVSADDDSVVEGLRALMIAGTLPENQLSMLAQARSLVHWHSTHGFCAACGAATRMEDAGYRRHCDGCNADHFPRTDPVVIMAVRDGSRVLLGRQASWPEGMYSTLAGFMEPGETLEQAVRREVKEEAGIDVGEVRYVASQPWPFPSSLMIGVVAEARSQTITLDAEELQDARWFEAKDLALMLEGQHPGGLYASRPQAIAHLLMRTALAQST